MLQNTECIARGVESRRVGRGCGSVIIVEAEPGHSGVRPRLPHAIEGCHIGYWEVYRGYWQSTVNTDSDSDVSHKN